MCLVALAIDQSRRFPLVVASNRDEFFERPTARLAWWSPRPDAPAVLAGRDLESGGSWLGLTAQGRLAMLTNVRNGAPQDPGAPSRGRIVTDWLSAREETGDFWMRTALSGYNGFNLIAADFAHGECFFASNVNAQPKRLERGLFGLSNGELDARWPKVEALKAGMREAIDTEAPVEEFAAQLFALLADRTVAPDNDLPQTGIAIERERQLSPAFIRTPDQSYGTRCSTLVITERAGRSPITHVFERTFSASGAVALLRRSTLRNWPPRYTAGDAATAVEQGTVSESEVAPSGDAMESPRRTRVRTLLKPALDGRRKRTVAHTG
jgi:uncharacterized protein with NRDE domain